MLKAVIFDFDYTLGDSTKGIVLSVNYALDRLGYREREREEIKKTIGLSLKDTYAVLTGKSDIQEAELFADYFKEKADLVMVDNTQLYEGVKETLQMLRYKGCQIGIVTTKFRYRIEQILSRFDALDLVDMIVGAEDVKVEKPNPEGLLWVVERLQLGKSDILYVGDSIVDAKTAQNADVNFAGVLTGTTTKQDFALYPSVYIGETIRDVYNDIKQNRI